MHSTGRRPFLAALVGAVSSLRLTAQQPYVPKQSDRPEPLTGDEPGFQPIFDGKTLHGWEGDPKYWRVADDVMIGEITPETIIKSNTFIIWRGGAPKDFELKVDYRITSGGNSGINYRSVVVPDPVTPPTSSPCAATSATSTARIDTPATTTKRRAASSSPCAARQPGSPASGPRSSLAILGDNKDLASTITADWNAIHLTARGNILMHAINGRLMSVVVDDDPAGRKMEGLIGVQVHVGGPMKVEYRNWRLKNM